MDVEEAMKVADEQLALIDAGELATPQAKQRAAAICTLAAEVRRLRADRAWLEDVYGAACVVDNANARRASAQVQDRCERTDYEATMGFALDTLRVKIDALRKERITAAEAARRKT